MPMAQPRTPLRELNSNVKLRSKSSSVISSEVEEQLIKETSKSRDSVAPREASIASMRQAMQKASNQKIQGSVQLPIALPERRSPRLTKHKTSGKLLNIQP